MSDTTNSEPIWHMELAVLAIIVFQFGLGDHFSFGSKYLIIVLECVQLLMLILLRNSAHPERDRWHWRITLFLTGFVTVVNIGSLLIVLRTLIEHPTGFTSRSLFLSAGATFVTNIIIFGLWYWQLDGGGPGGRGAHKPPIDFVFPQMFLDPKITQTPNWRADFIDYLYLSITNATAPGPTDVTPLTNRAKMLMAVQSFTSIILLVIVVTRAVAILT